MIPHILELLILIPIVSAVLVLCIPKKYESAIAAVAIAGVTADFFLYLTLVFTWITGGLVPISAYSGVLYTRLQYTFALDWYFDAVSALFFGLTSIITLLILIFSRYYMHRDSGFTRYFGTILLFFIGLTLIILSGNLDVLFLGWEWIGISSFLLIAYYRDRFLPVRNALKVFSLYRIADALLIIALWLGHHSFEQSIKFIQIPDIIMKHGSEFTLIGFLFLLVALIKSAQFPFSYWLPRAMEGPTTSSAIFYGALSVHMGLFVLLRTFPLWQGSIVLRVSMALVGALSALIASSITRVQSSIKTQIAYASITQIGIMFIELALGLRWLVFLHMVSNAFLRAYQLLISPSIVGYLIHDQFYYFVDKRNTIPNTFYEKIATTTFVLGLKEWDMNATMTRIIWKPLKTIGRFFSFLDSTPTHIVKFVLFLLVLSVMALHILPVSPSSALSFLTIVISIVFFIRAYATKYAPKRTWKLIMAGHLFVMLFFSFATNREWHSMFLYASGILSTFVAGYLCLKRLQTRGEDAALSDYHGHVYEYPRLAFLFFLICLGYMAFPIIPSFLGLDMLLSTIPIQSAIYIVLFGIAYLLAGVSTMRLYVKVFFGPHSKRYHETAKKSS